MPMFSSLPDWVAYLFTALIIFAFLVLIYLLIDWLRLQRQMRKLREELEHATHERDRNARIMGSMDRQKALLQDQVQKSNDQVDTLTRRLAETTGLLSAARLELLSQTEEFVMPSDENLKTSEVSRVRASEVYKSDPLSLLEDRTVTAPSLSSTLEPQADRTPAVFLTAEPAAVQHGLHAQMPPVESDQSALDLHALTAEPAAAQHELGGQVRVDPTGEQGRALVAEIGLAGLQAELADLRVSLQQQTQTAQHLQAEKAAAVADLQTQLQSAQARYAEAQAALSQYETRLAQHHQQVAEASHAAPNVTTLVTQLSAAQASVALSDADLLHLNEVVRLLSDELADSKASFGMARATVEELQRQLSEVRTAKATLENRTGSLEAQVHGLLSQVATTNSAIAERDGALHQLQRVADESKPSTLFAHDRENPVRLAQISAHEAAQALADRAELQQMRDRIDALTAQLDTAQKDRDTRVAELTLKLADTQALFEDASAKLSLKSANLSDRGPVNAAENTSEHEAQLQALNSKIVTLQSRLAQANEALQQRETRLAEVGAHTGDTRSEFDPTNAVVAAREAAIAELKAQLGNTKTSLDIASDAVFARDAQLAQLNLELKRLRAELAVLGGPPASLTGAPITLADEQVDADLQSAKTIIAHRDARVSEMEETLADLTEKQHALQVNFMGAEAIITQRDAQVYDLGERLAELEAQVAKHAADLDVANATLAERLTAISELNHELDASDQSSEETHTSSRAELNALQTTLAERETALAASRQAVADLTEQLTRAHDVGNAISQIETQLHEAQTKIKTQSDAIAALTSKLRIANGELEQAQRRTAADSADINALYAQINAQVEAQAEMQTQMQATAHAEASAKVQMELGGQPMGDFADESVAEPLTWVPVTVDPSTPVAGSPSRITKVGKATTPNKTLNALEKPERPSKPTKIEKPRKLEPTEVIAPVKKIASVEKPTKSAKPEKADKLSKASKPKSKTEVDPLEEIVGIGQTYVGKLNKAGIRTFKGLAKSKPSQLERIIKPKDWQKIDFAGWIAQAKAKTKE